MSADRNVVSTSELTPEEIVFARDADNLFVQDDGCGFVPRDWLERFRARAKSLATEGPFDGLTAHATACINCPSKVPPEWNVRLLDGKREYRLTCCMCGRQTNWTTDWKGLTDWWNTQNPALPDGTKVKP